MYFQRQSKQPRDRHTDTTASHCPRDPGEKKIRKTEPDFGSTAHPV